MSVIVIFGGTGYTGRNVAREAAARGHTVIAVSRSTPSDPLPGVRYETGDVREIAPRVIPAADAVVATLSPRGDMAGRLVDIYRDSPIMRQLRDYPTLKGKCSWCDFRDICGGSRSRSFGVTGDYLASEPYCSYFPQKPKNWGK